jgi:hypothetical protein
MTRLSVWEQETLHGTAKPAVTLVVDHRRGKKYLTKFRMLNYTHKTKNNILTNNSVSLIR